MRGRSDTVQFRRSGSRLFETCFLALGTALLVAGAIQAAEPTATTDAHGLAVVLAGASACLVLLTIRSFRRGIFADTNGVLVRNLTRTRYVPWADIERIEPPRQWGYHLRVGIGFELRGGRRVYAGLYGAAPMNSAHFADDVVARLRSMRAANGDGVASDRHR